MENRPESLVQKEEEDVSRRPKLLAVLLQHDRSIPKPVAHAGRQMGCAKLIGPFIGLRMLLKITEIFI
jgi:hypothetical protein